MPAKSDFSGANSGAATSAAAAALADAAPAQSASFALPAAAAAAAALAAVAAAAVAAAAAALAAAAFDKPTVELRTTARSAAEAPLESYAVHPPKEPSRHVHFCISAFRLAGSKSDVSLCCVR